MKLFITLSKQKKIKNKDNSIESLELQRIINFLEFSDSLIQTHFKIFILKDLLFQHLRM